MGRTGRKRSKPKRRQVDHEPTSKALDEKSNRSPTIPVFDPSVEEPRIDLWLEKVNEVATLLRWDESKVIQSAITKLKGEAKRWSQTYSCEMFSWDRWQTMLSYAFPCTTMYPELLSAMLNRSYKNGDDIEEYYHDKMSLLYACKLSGSKAVDCVIHGIEDHVLHRQATAESFLDPEDLFAYLKEVCIERKDIEVTRCV